MAMQEGVDAFLEEAVVRRELSDNFCFYEPNYDNLSCCANWAKESLEKHSSDKREYTYTWSGAASCAPSHWVLGLRPKAGSDTGQLRKLMGRCAVQLWC